MGALRSIYARLGKRYPRRVLLAGLPTGPLTGLLATAGTALYVDMSAVEFVRLVLASWILLWASEIVLDARLVDRAVRPIEEWLESRDPARAVAAWQAATGLPLRFLRSSRLYLVAAPGIVIWGLYAVWELDVPTASAPIFFVASALVYAYWIALRFLAMELALRPLVEDVSASLPSDPVGEAGRVPLRWRLIASVTAVTVITGVAVGGFSADRSEDLSALGLALLGSAVAGALVSSWLIVFLSTSITVPIGQLRDAAARVGQGDLEVRVPVASADETGELARAFNVMVDGLRQRERLREAFGTFVDPQLAERVLEEGTDLAGEEVEVTVVFIDVRGFTTYAERAQAREVVARLNDLYELVVPVILRHGGHANKFIGDGLLAVFGAPERLPDHADRAVATALEIADLVRERYDGRLRVGIGINTGQVVVGTIGGGGRLDFTVIGDVVNTAARVESATRATDDDVLITEATREKLADGRRWEERPPVELKGKSSPTRLFAPAR